MSSPLAPSQSHPTQHSVQLPRELWCDITARILGDYLYDLIIGTGTRSDDDYEDENEDQRPRTITHPNDTCQCSIQGQPEWDAIATLLHISRLVRSCTLDHLAFLCHRPGNPPPAPSHDPDSGTRTPSYEHEHDYRPLVAHLRALRDDGIDTLVLEEWDYAPGARFFGLPRSLMGTRARAEMEEEQGQGQGQGQGLPPVLVLARLRHTLAASDAFACEGWDWFPYNAPEVYDAGCTALLVSTYCAVPAYARSALLRRVVERIAMLQVARITLSETI
ncbi:hypothetical protein BJY52DRAFT_1303877 [Lactarius psammicola]|nr:hypothetical protein BJY52DRAFT_1303877 [Lactarius psammicola]